MTFHEAQQVIEWLLADMTSVDLEARRAGDPDARELVIIPEGTVNTDYGWLFTYDDRRYAETRDPVFCILGECPMLVMKGSGRVFRLWSGLSRRRALFEFEDELRLKGEADLENDSAQREWGGFVGRYHGDGRFIRSDGKTFCVYKGLKRPSTPEGGAGDA